MKYPQYEKITVSSDKLEFVFESTGPKGIIKKVVQFTKTSNKRIYNLAFGNLNSDGSIDDVTKTDNKDRNKILATVAGTVYEFTTKYPGATIFFCGTTPERTRLYRMAISINLDELKKDFSIHGILMKGAGYQKVAFRKGKNYIGFMITRRKILFL